jgi:hypothetical protein
MALSPDEKLLLQALAHGCALKSHRDIDGSKCFRLHPLTGPDEVVQKKVVDALLRQGLISSNQKFPAATFMLTEKGRIAAAALEQYQN